MTLEYFQVYKSVYCTLVTHSIQHPSRNVRAWDANPELPEPVGANALLTAQAAAGLQ